MNWRSTLAVLTALAGAMPRPAAAAPVLRHQMTLNGDFTLIGNTVAHDCAAGVTPVVGTVGACGNNTSDSGVDVFWRSDPAAGTAAANTSITAAQAQSTGVLGTGALPAGAIVRYARLYWGAQSSGTGYDAAASILAPNGTTYAVTADQGTVINPAAGAYWYQSSANVTSILQGLANPRGAYTVSGVDSRNLVNLNSNTVFVAWWMVIFYEDPADPAVRQLTLFDGLDYVSGGAPANVSLGGFLVPNGGFDAKLGVVTYEGDSSITGDQLLFQGYRSTGPAPSVLTVLSDALNPATNFFNGTRGWLGVAQSNAGDLPRMSGGAASMMSFDFDVVDLKVLGAIAPGDDAAVISATSSGDVYALGAFITSINTLKPSFIQTVKTATNLTRPDGFFPGDLVEYVLDTTNTGNDPSIQTVMRDPLPAGVTYVPNTLEIVSGANAGSKTDAAGDDQAEYDSGARTLVVRLGAGATAAAGGTMAIGDSARVRFRVTIDVGTSGTVRNQAFVEAAGLSGEPLRTFDSSPPLGTGPTAVPIDACLDDTHCGGSTPACLTAAVPNVCVGCTDATYCGGATPICDLSAFTCVGLTTIAPAAQDRTTVPGVPAPFPMTLTSNPAGPDVYALDVVDSGCGWGVELRTPGGALLGTRDGAGVWTIAPGGDTNGDGLPDLGATAGSGGTSGFVLWLTPPAATPLGSACPATLVATGASSGLVAQAAATLRTGAAATYTPDRTGASGKAVPQGSDVGFPGVIQNNGTASLDFALAASVTATPPAGALAPAVFWSDPNGDGDPSDGAPITTTGPVAPFGGTVRVVLVLRASTAGGAPLATGTILDATATATAGAVVATQVSQARVQYAATYSDAARTLVRSRFAPCDTVYLGARLLPAGFPFALEWYAMANPVRGVDAPHRTVDPWPVSGGAGNDVLALPANASGTWTVLVVQKAGPDAVIDTVVFDVERAGAFVSLAVPSRIALGSGISATATVRNDNDTSPYLDSRIAYAVTDGALYMDGAGAFGAAPATARLTSSVDVAAGATASDSWAVGTPAWPGPGLYRVDAEWRLQCGATPAVAVATASFEVIPNPPAVTAPAAGALLSTRTPAVSGTAMPGASVSVTAGASSCGPVVAAGDGTWTCTLGPPLADGAHSVTAVQVVGGATSDPSAPVGFTVDGTPPSVAIAVPSNGALLGAADAPGGLVAFSGTAEVGATVTVTVGAASASATRAGASWSATLVLADGLHTATATATDAAGNSASDLVSFTLDTAAPAIPVIGYPADGAVLSAADAPGGMVTITGTAEAGAVVEVTVGGDTRTATRSGSSWSVTFVLADGAYVVTANATDAAGNRSGDASSSFSIDSGIPNAPAFDFPLDGAVLGAAAAPGGVVTLTGPTDAGTSVTVVVDGVPYAASVTGTQWTLTVTLVDGAHAASATARDGAGNDSAPTTIFFSLDTAAPSAPVLDALASPTSASSVTVTGTAEPGSAVTISMDGTAVGTVTAAGDGTFSLVVAVTEGTRAFTAVAADGAGNVSPQSNVVTVVVDRTAPSAPAITSPTEGAVLVPGPVVVSGTAEPGATVSVVIDGVTYTAVAAGDGTFSVTADLPAGSWTATATATDAAGNTSSAASVSFTTEVPGSGAHVSGAGGCGCGPGGGASPATLLLLSLALVFAPRRRREAR